MILQLNPPIPMITPKGHGYANFLVDRGIEYNNEWIVFLDSGEIWSFLNDKVRLEKNYTYGRFCDGKDQSERKCTDEHLKAPARPIRFLQPGVSPASGGMGEETDGEGYVAEFIYEPTITNDAWVTNLYRTTESPSSGECPT